MATIPSVQVNTVKDKVYNLNVELKEIQARKKALVGGMNDEIKRIKNEIDELIEEQENDAPVANVVDDAPAPRVQAGV